MKGPRPRLVGSARSANRSHASPRYQVGCRTLRRHPHALGDVLAQGAFGLIGLWVVENSGASLHRIPLDSRFYIRFPLKHLQRQVYNHERRMLQMVWYRFYKRISSCLKWQPFHTFWGVNLATLNPCLELAAHNLQLCYSCTQVIKHDSTPRSQFHHVCDIAPTIYEALVQELAGFLGHRPIWLLR